MLGLLFLQPIFLWGALLFLVPLLIHLLNRRRYIKREWAAMEFLNRAFKKVRRRLRLEDLILLLLRCLIPVALAFALARPTVSRQSPLSGLAQSPLHHIIVVDATLSNSQKPKARVRPITRARALAEKYLKKLKPVEFQQVSLIRVDTRAKTVAERETKLERALHALDKLCKPGFGASSLVPGLELARDIAKEPGTRSKVLVFTDLQKAALGEEPEEKIAADPLAGILKELKDICGMPVIIVDTGPDKPAPNLSIVSLTVDEPVVVRGQPLTVRAKLKNFSKKGLKGIRVSFDLDGQPRPSDVVDIPPNGFAEAVSRFSILRVGPHWIRASVPHDSLEGDDSAWISIVARPRIRVLFVEGKPNPDPMLTATSYISMILDPGGEELAESSLFKSEEMDALDFTASRTDLQGNDILVIGDLDRVSPGIAEEIKAFVKKGGGLLVFPGPDTEPASWNLRLSKANGSGPIPLRFVEPQGFTERGTNYFLPLLPKNLDHPALKDFRGPLRLVLSRIPIYRFYRCEVLDEKAEVLLRVSDPGSSPLMVSYKYGLGKLIVFTSPITDDDDRWNEFNTPLVAFPLLYQTALYLAPTDRGMWNVAVGKPIAPRFKEQPNEVHVTPPQETPFPLPGSSKQMAEGDYAWTPFTGTEKPGIYRFDITWPDTMGSKEWPYRFGAVNIDSKESDLEKTTMKALEARLGNPGGNGIVKIEKALPGKELPEAQDKGGDIGYGLLYFVLTILLLEGLLGTWLGRKRA